MSGPREAVVQQLVQAALAGMEEVGDDFTGDEMVSACFTLAKTMIRTVLITHPQARSVIQDAIRGLLIDCVDTTKES